MHRAGKVHRYAVSPHPQLPRHTPALEHRGDRPFHQSLSDEINAMEAMRHCSQWQQVLEDKEFCCRIMVNCHLSQKGTAVMNETAAAAAAVGVGTSGAGGEATKTVHIWQPKVRKPSHIDIPPH